MRRSTRLSTSDRHIYMPLLLRPAVLLLSIRTDRLPSRSLASAICSLEQLQEAIVRFEEDLVQARDADMVRDM